MHCVDLREKRSAQCVASRTMRSQPTSCCVGMPAQKSAFQQVRASHCQGATFMAVRVASNLYAAIGKLVGKLARLSRKRKTRLAKTFDHPGRSETSAEVTVPPHPQNVLPEPSDTPGQSRTHEGGQEMRVFPFRRKGAFAASPIPIGRGIRP